MIVTFQQVLEEFDPYLKGSSFIFGSNHDLNAAN
jgi:hypothetical protein